MLNGKSESDNGQQRDKGLMKLAGVVSVQVPVRDAAAFDEITV